MKGGYFFLMRNDKGVAGLTVLLSLIVMLFVIGLLVMIFVLMSGQLSSTESFYTRGGNILVANESVTLTTAGTTLANGNKYEAICTVLQVYNGTTLLNSNNYTQVSSCVYSNNSIYTDWRFTYTYSYLEGSSAITVINDTGNSIAEVTDYFSLFIVIGSMVVLILLTVIIITAIRTSGLIGGDTTSKPKMTGTA